MAHFDDVILPDSFAFDAAMGPSKNNQVLFRPNGFRKTNVLMAQFIRKFRIAFPPGRPDKRYEILRIYASVGGTADTFLGRDWSDWNTTDGFMGPTGESSITMLDMPLQNTTDQTFVGDGTTTVFQMVKRYIEGASAVHTRPITKPFIKGLFPLFALDAVQKFSPGDLTFDVTTGLVTFAVAPAAAAVPTWGGLFRIIIGFVNPDLITQLTSYDVNEVPSVEVIEIRIP